MTHAPSASDGTIPAHALAALMLAPLLWAGNFVVGRWAHVDADPLTLNFLRWSVTAVALSPLLFVRGRAVARCLAARPGAVLLLAALGVAGFNTVLYAGLGRTTAGAAGVIFGLTPLLILALARIWGGQAPARLEVAGGVLAFGGVALVASGGAGGVEEGGAALVFAAALLWAGFTVALKRLPLDLPPLTGLALISTVGCLLMLPFLPLMAPVAALSAPGSPVAVAYLAFGASILAFAAWTRGVSAVGAGRAGIFLHLIPVFGVALGALLLDEIVTAEKIAGLALVVGGVLVAQSGERLPQRSSRRAETARRSAQASRLAEGVRSR
ncbi:MAG: DMT family transporter [Pseudomonadota bacterium]